MERRRKVDRRTVVGGLGIAAIHGAQRSSARASLAPLRFGLTPVFLTSDLTLLAGLQAYLETATRRPVELINKRTYQEITALLVTGQLDAAWICGYPFVAYRNQLSLVAVPIWNGQTRYQSYLIARTDRRVSALSDLRGTVHAFSDPDSNSGYLVTRAALIELGATPSSFFRHAFFTYGHRNVIRAVSAGLADGGSVDGYVYEVLRASEPELVAKCAVVTKSEWLGFPPVACRASEADSEATFSIRRGLVDMATDPRGREVLSLLRLDGFKVEPPEHFDGIAAKMQIVRGTQP